MEFQAETKRLLDLVINSIYTNKEIFLRELISNASDAIDKLHFESLTNQNILENNSDYEIFIVPDSESKTITISDNGIGMTRDEIISNIGTIAKSGTKAFLEQLKNNGEPTEEMIGQFGIGFYSAFIVADKVTIITRKAGQQESFKWESDGAGEYTIEEFEKESRGTTITLQLKKEFTEGEENFTDINHIERLIKKYSDYIRYPIKMNFETEDAEKNKTIEVRTVNSMQPLWTKNKSDIKSEEYNEFFKMQFHEWQEPFEVYHMKAEGTIEYTALLCIPKKAPMDLYYSNFEPGLQLYSRHVLIMDKCKDFLPDYLRFVKGLVDSPDLQLNISREMLQQSREVKKIGKAIEKNILKQLKKLLADDRDKYEKFFAEYGKAFKVGIYNDGYLKNISDDLKDLLIFQTSAEGKFSTLNEYVTRMKSDQEKIYYVAAKDIATIEKLPQMELLKDRGIEVLYLFDPVDEFTIEVLHEYEGKHFQSISREDFKLDDEKSKEEQKQIENLTKDNEKILNDVKESLKDKVNDVKLTSQLKSGAVCLVTGAAGPSLTMEKTFAAMNNNFFKASKILEINPNHQLFNKLKEVHGTDKFNDFCDLMYCQALLIEGVLPDNHVELANKIAELMTK